MGVSWEEIKGNGTGAADRGQLIEAFSKVTVVKYSSALFPI